MTRSVLYILLPLSVVWTLMLGSQGVVQTFTERVEVQGLEQTQTLVLGPVASQVAIKQLGSNGGGYYNTNSAHPFENPTPLSNFLEMLAILLIPLAMVFTFGSMIGDRRQSVCLLAVMAIMWLPFYLLVYTQETGGNPLIATTLVDQEPSEDHPGGNMNGKELRFGHHGVAIWTTTTAGMSNGAVNAMHDSLMPLSGLAPLMLVQLEETIIGGAGSGAYGMVGFVLLTVFIAGLMVGRTPEYLGKKVGPLDIKMASIIMLIPCVATLTATAIACILPAGVTGISNPGPHGFSQIMYAFTSASNNNGSAFAGLNANSVFYNILLGACMLAGRFLVMIAVLLLAGSLAAKQPVPISAGTLPTHTPLFALMILGVIFMVGILTYAPALALGPIVEHLQLITGTH